MTNSGACMKCWVTWILLKQNPEMQPLTDEYEKKLSAPAPASNRPQATKP